MMRIEKRLGTTLLALVMGLMAGCGGGGGSASSTQIAGTASKGIVYPGTVNVYALDAGGTKGTSPIATAATDSSGKFSADLGGYSGAVVIEVSGTYTDEATGTAATITSARPMRAAVDTVDNSHVRRIAVTPLTDLACSLAGTLNAQNIAAANARIADIFKVSDITGIEPVRPDATLLASATTDQQAYTLALAAISQMAKTANPGAPAPSFGQIVALLDSFKTDLTSTATAGLSPAHSSAFATALSQSIGGQLPGVTGSLSGLSTATATLSSVGSTSLKLTLSVTVPSGTLIGGVQGRLTLPSGAKIRVKSATDSEVLAGLFSAAGGTTGALATAGFISPYCTFGLLSASGFSAGDFAVLTVDVTSGSPTAADFVMDSVKVIDVRGAAVNASISVK